jgi:tetratricopeptide (TPR) repeat protein
VSFKKSTLWLNVLLVHLHTTSSLFNIVYKGHDSWDTTEKSIKIAQEIGDRENEGARLGKLGNAYRALGEVRKAMQYYEKALKVAQEIGDRRGEGVRFGGLGNAYSALGEVRKAMQYYEKALKVAQEIGDKKNESTWLGNLGIAYCNLRQRNEAIEYYKKALKIAQDLNYKRDKSTWLGSLGTAFGYEKKYREAMACYLLSRDIRIQIRDPNLKTTESNLNKLKDELGEKEFEKLEAEVAPRAEEIVGKLLK